MVQLGVGHLSGRLLPQKTLRRTQNLGAKPDMELFVTAFALQVAAVYGPRLGLYNLLLSWIIVLGKHLDNQRLMPYLKYLLNFFMIWTFMTWAGVLDEVFEPLDIL